MSAITIKIPDEFQDVDHNGKKVTFKTKAGIKKVSARWRIEALPNRSLVWRGRARGGVTIDLDPGKYIWVANYYDKTKINNFKMSGEFLHDVTPEQWQHLEYIEPRIAKAVFTTHGMVYRCQFVGCDEEHSNRIAAAIHEGEHQGIDLLATPEAKPEVDSGVEKYMEEKSGKRRGPGRPRKSEAERLS
jgi:hypothetical protein